MLLEAAHRTIDRLVMLRVGEANEALDVLERGRASIAHRPPAPFDRSVHTIVSDPHTVLVDYALIGDTLLTWTSRAGRLRLHRAMVDRLSLLNSIERVGASLARRGSDDATNADLTSLYDCLLRPILPDLSPTDTSLIVVADGELAMVPFAALRDREGGQYAVERYTLRFANSVADAVNASRPAPGVEVSRPLVIADPAFDSRSHPELDRLAGASAEAAALHAIYPSATMLTGSAATRSAIVSALRSADIVHFAGHTLIDDDSPDRSYLVLARSADATADADLDAATIAGFDLHAVRLVVLSSCETAVTHPGRSGGLAGLTGAFLRSGARGVVGSLWHVNDEFTQALMLELHRAYRVTGDGATAVRSAQLRLLHGADATLHSPAAWAAFRYTGS
jgi:CHAT domain-containing protein